MGLIKGIFSFAGEVIGRTFEALTGVAYESKSYKDYYSDKSDAEIKRDCRDSHNQAQKIGGCMELNERQKNRQ